MAFTFMRADENMVYGGTVATSAGTTDTAHVDDWLVDGRGRPARATTGTVTWAITGLVAKDVTLIVVHGHTVDPTRAITVSGGVSATLNGPTARANGIPYNPWGTCTLANTASVTVTVASNSVAVIMAEVLAGKLRSTDRDLPANGFDIEYLVFKVGSGSQFGSVPGVDLGMEARRLSVPNFVVTQAERDTLIAFWEASRNDTKPSVIIPFPEYQDAWVVKFVSFRVRALVNCLFSVSMVFEEWPRTRWIPS